MMNPVERMSGNAGCTMQINNQTDEVVRALRQLVIPTVIHVLQQRSRCKTPKEVGVEWDRSGQICYDKAVKTQLQAAGTMAYLHTVTDQMIAKIAEEIQWKIHATNQKE